MNQLFEDGKVINVDGVELECVGVSYQETDGERHSFGYTFRPKTEVDAEREAQAEAERLAAEASPVEVQQPEPLPVSVPEENKEETLNVK